MDSMEHDDLLFSMLKDCKTLPVFLNQIFGFLSRRTDFYYVTDDVTSPVGLPPGLAEQTVKQIFHRWKPDKTTTETKQPETSRIKPTAKCQPSTNQFTSSECYNGATHENYSWSQTLLEVDVIVKLPDNTTSKDLTVNIQNESISVTLKDGAVLLEGELCDRCRGNEAIWSLQNNKLDIHLDKCKELWWNCLVRSEPKLDISKLDCSRPFEELSDEAQAKIEELQWNQERKRLGLPTSDETAAHSILKRSWDAEGTPFSGPFDPSSVQFN